MIVCSCNVLSDGQISKCLKEASALPATAREVYDRLGCAPQCGRCVRTVVDLLQQATHDRMRQDEGPCTTSLLAAE